MLVELVDARPKAWRDVVVGARRSSRILPLALSAPPVRPPAGFALVLVLWVLAFLSVIAIALIRETREQTRFAAAMLEDAKAEALAEGGVQRAMAALLDPAPDWQADGAPHELRLGDGVVTVRIEDESGKIDLNRADDAALVSLLESAGLELEEARRLAAAIEDYRDPDDIRRPGGAEAVDYQAAGLTHGPRNAPFESPEELLEVLGMTPAVLAAVEPLLTVYSPAQEVNLAAASEAVLRALPRLDPARLEQLRALKGGGAPPVSQAVVVTVTAAAETRGGGHFIRVAILRRTTLPTRPFDVLSWRRTWPEGAAGAP